MLLLLSLSIRGKLNHIGYVPEGSGFFGRPLVGQRHLNPENPVGYITAVTGREEEYPIVQRSIAL
jgi:hypothetical protein